MFEVTQTIKKLNKLTYLQGAPNFNWIIHHTVFIHSFNNNYHGNYLEQHALHFSQFFMV